MKKSLVRSVGTAVLWLSVGTLGAGMSAVRADDDGTGPTDAITTG